MVQVGRLEPGLVSDPGRLTVSRPVRFGRSSFR
jgi:hypothetical protein